MEFELEDELILMSKFDPVEDGNPELICETEVYDSGLHCAEEVGDTCDAEVVNIDDDDDAVVGRDEDNRMVPVSNFNCW